MLGLIGFPLRWDRRCPPLSVRPLGICGFPCSSHGIPLGDTANPSNPRLWVQAMGVVATPQFRGDRLTAPSPGIPKLRVKTATSPHRLNSPLGVQEGQKDGEIPGSSTDRITSSLAQGLGRGHPQGPASSNRSLPWVLEGHRPGHRKT